MAENNELVAKTAEAQIAKLKKEFGKDFICRLDELPEVEVFKTRFYTINKLIGVGGIPKGRIIELVGTEGSGKTTMALTLCADAQMSGLVCAYVDLERKVIPSYAAALGVDIKELLILRPENGDNAMYAMDKLVDTGAVQFIVLDSVTNLTTAGELEKEIYEPNMALTARLMSQSIRRLIGKSASRGVTLLFINQYRKDVGKMYGNPDKSSGGNALQYGNTLKIELRAGKSIMDEGKQLGNEVSIHISKNQVSAPHTKGNMNLYYGFGFDSYGDIYTAAVDNNIITGGAYAKYKDSPIGHGKAQTCERLRTDPELLSNILKDLEETYAAE